MEPGEITKDLRNVTGVKGVIISNPKGIVYDKIMKGADVATIESMGHVIAESSQKLLKRAKKGEFESVILEFHKGNLIIINSESFRLLVLTEKDVNLGLIILLSKRTIRELDTLKTGLESTPHEIAIKESHEEPQTPSEISKAHEPPERPTPHTPKIETGKEKIREVENRDIEAAKPPPMEKGEKIKSKVPEVKPPLSLPHLETDIKVPESPEDKIKMTLEVYEYLLLAMSIGASKIMGVAPARGMLRKSLPYEKCPILEGVDVDANASLKFDTLKSNIKKAGYTLKEIIEDLNKIIWVITENYGRVMGYDAFRGMIRPEFKTIFAAYSKVMKKLGIINGIHPELRKLWEETI